MSVSPAPEHHLAPLVPPRAPLGLPSGSLGLPSGALGVPWGSSGLPLGLKFGPASWDTKKSVPGTPRFDLDLSSLRTPRDPQGPPRSQSRHPQSAPGATWVPLGPKFGPASWDTKKSVLGTSPIWSRFIPPEDPRDPQGPSGALGVLWGFPGGCPSAPRRSISYVWVCSVPNLEPNGLPETALDWRFRSKPPNGAILGASKSNINQSIYSSVSQPISQSVRQSVSQSVSRSVCQSVNHSICQSVSQSVSSNQKVEREIPRNN